MLHVWNIYLHLAKVNTPYIMDHLGTKKRSSSSFFGCFFFYFVVKTPSVRRSNWRWRGEPRALSNYVSVRCVTVGSKKSTAAAWACLFGDDDRYDTFGPIQPLYNLYIGGICWYIYISGTVPRVPNFSL